MCNCVCVLCACMRERMLKKLPLCMCERENAKEITIIEGLELKEFNAYWVFEDREKGS